MSFRPLGIKPGIFLPFLCDSMVYRVLVDTVVVRQWNGVW